LKRFFLQFFPLVKEQLELKGAIDYWINLLKDVEDPEFKIHNSGGGHFMLESNLSIGVLHASIEASHFYA